MMYKSLPVVAALMMLVQIPSIACTSVIVSGRVTPDGRPLMWKNRDTGAKGNYVRYFPATTVCLPIWGCFGQEGIPVLLGDGSRLCSELSQWGTELKKNLYCFDMDNTSGQIYFKRTLLTNNEGTGYLQMIQKAEPELLRPYEEALEHWRIEDAVNPKELSELNRIACGRIRELYGPLL